MFYFQITCAWLGYVVLPTGGTGVSPLEVYMVYDLLTTSTPTVLCDWVTLEQQDQLIWSGFTNNFTGKKYQNYQMCPAQW